MAKNTNSTSQIQKRAGGKIMAHRRARKSVSTAEEELRVEEGRTALTLRRRVAYFSLSIFTLNALGALVVVFLVGFGLMVLSKEVIITLILETVAHAAAVFMTVARNLFPGR